MGYTGSALAALDSGLPRRSHIFVSSIPDLYQLWAIYHTRSTAQFVWDVADICHSLLAPDRTDEQRNQVRERNIAFNTVLQQECAKYSRASSMATPSSDTSSPPMTSAPWTTSTPA